MVPLQLRQYHCQHLVGNRSRVQFLHCGWFLASPEVVLPVLLSPQKLPHACHVGELPSPHSLLFPGIGCLHSPHSPYVDSVANGKWAGYLSLMRPPLLKNDLQRKIGAEISES